jgi:methylated-DNA-protein-cysteine methyltransferase related protein
VAAVTDEQVERVRSLVAAIPSGRVVTYGDIAAVAGLSSPRIVGWIMRTDSSDLPWHRVITASGRPARHLTTRQLELLRAEGVLAVDGRIALAEVRYEFPAGPRGDRKRGEAGRGGSPPGSTRGDRKRGEAGRGGSPPGWT